MRSLFVGVLLFSFSAFAQFEAEKIYHGKTGREVPIRQVIDQVEPGTVVLLGEKHDSQAHHNNQRDFLLYLSQTGDQISVGMEFFNYLQQPLVDRYLKDDISEEDFLKAISWGGFPFDFYRFQVLFPPLRRGETVALNAPRSLTSRIGKVGLAGLTDEERKLLPPDFQMGNELYFERFAKAMSKHGDIDKETLQKYFEAQCVWDDTMAWQAELAMKRYPEQVFVIIVGDFHVQYGGGLPDRLRQRGLTQLMNISQVAVEGLSKDEKAEIILPSDQYGPRANFVWVSE